MGDLYQPPVMTTVTNATAATLSPGIAQSGTLFVLDRAAGITVTLPAIDAGEIGTKFKFLVKTTVTSNANIIKVPSAAETMTGSVIVQTDTTNGVLAFKAASTSDTITLNGSTTGGIAGDILEVEAVSTTLWKVLGVTSATGTEATPFSAAVS